jgi:hypothetical protein
MIDSAELKQEEERLKGLLEQYKKYDPSDLSGNQKRIKDMMADLGLAEKKSKGLSASDNAGFDEHQTDPSKLSGEELSKEIEKRMQKRLAEMGEASIDKVGE